MLAKQVCSFLYVLENDNPLIDVTKFFVDIVNESMKTTETTSLSGGCIFFGVPNQTNDIAGVLHRFKSAYMKGSSLVEEDKKAQHIANSAREFSAVRDDHNLSILCFIETEQYNSIMVSYFWGLCTYRYMLERISLPDPPTGISLSTLKAFVDSLLQARSF